MHSIDNYLLGLRQDTKFNDFGVGDVLLVRYEGSSGYWKARTFVGVCIAKTGATKKGNLRFILRNVIKGISVEFAFYYFSPTTIGVEKLPIQKFFKIKRAKLYYLRNQAQSRSTVKI